MFPDVEATLRKMKGLLAEDGILVVYGYIPVDVQDENAQGRTDYTVAFDEFCKLTIPLYQSELKALYAHYQNYPFEKYFRTKFHKEQVGNRMSKAAFLNYHKKTAPMYRDYLEKYQKDPMRNLETILENKDLVSVEDYFMIVCRHK